MYNTQEMPATRDLFKQLYRRDHEEGPISGEDNWKEITTDDFTVKGTMTSNSNSKLTDH